MNIPVKGALTLKEYMTEERCCQNMIYYLTSIDRLLCIYKCTYFSDRLYLFKNILHFGRKSLDGCCCSLTGKGHQNE